jgi:hypothetical protein
MNRRCLVFLLSALAAGCSSTTPGGPSPFGTPSPDPGPVVTNTPPLIGALTVQGTRTNEPPNFADASEEVPITVAVTDAESPISDLRFNWTSSAGGTFIGSGPKVTWKAPDKVEAPTTVTLSVEVVETYTSQGKQLTNNPKGSVTLSLHDSVKEVGDIAVQFLKDFSDTSIKDVPYIIRSFEPGCYGTDGEIADVARHIQNYSVTAWRVESAVVSVAFGAACSLFPDRFRPGDACAEVRTFWASTANKDVYNEFGEFVIGAGGHTTTSGVDQVVGRYYKDLQRWRLCASDFKGDDPPQTSLKILLSGLVP